MGLRTVILLSIGATVTRGASLGGSCCEEKTVGGVKYKKSGEEDTSSFNCLNNCVYEKVDSPGSKYCFKEGDLTVECGKGGTENCTSKACEDAASRLRFSMDTSVDPCDNFYDFVCGGFHEKTTVPEDINVLGSLIDMKQNAEKILYDVLDDEGESDEPSAFKSVRNYYRTCRETQDNREDLKSLLMKTGGLPLILGESWDENNFNWDDTAKKLAKEGVQVASGIGILTPVIKGVKENASNRIIEIFPDGNKNLAAGLNDPTVKKYYDYMVKIAVHLGADEAAAKEDMRNAFEFEKKLGELQGPTAENTMTVSKAAELFPGFDMLEYLKSLLGLDTLKASEVIKIHVPDYIKKLGDFLKETPKKTQANYLGYKAVASLMRYVSEEARIIQQEWDKVTKPNDPSIEPNRTIFCMQEVANLNDPGKYQEEADLTNAVGSMFARKASKSSFSKEAKESSVAMINGIKAQFKKMLQDLDWMDAQTKEAALDKESKMGVYVGYVDELFDNEIMDQFYSNLNLLQNSYLENYLMLQKFNAAYFASEYKKKKDIKNWNLHGVTYIGHNAWYGGSINGLTMPAARLSPPLHGLDYPKYWNYGSTGWTAGHEVTHAFDTDGKDFDADGNKRNWWTSTSEAEFNNRTKCLEDLYSTYSGQINGEDVTVDGKQTVGENIADYGGMKATYRAYQQAVENDKPDKSLPGFDYTPNQLFWIAGAYTYCLEYRDPKFYNQMVKNDEHSPTPVRVNAVFSGMPEFAADWKCPFGSVMNPTKRCTVY